MKRSSFAAPVAAMLVLAAALLWAGNNERETLRQRRQELRLQLAVTRVRLLREDPELKQLNERIESLQRVLLKKLDEHSEMKVLLTQLRQVEERLH